MKFFTPVVLALLATASTSAAFAPAGKFIPESRRIGSIPTLLVRDFKDSDFECFFLTYYIFVFVIFASIHSQVRCAHLRPSFFGSARGQEVD
jgi:hypothetical protein